MRLRNTLIAAAAGLGALALPASAAFAGTSPTSSVPVSATLGTIAGFAEMPNGAAFGSVLSGSTAIAQDNFAVTSNDRNGVYMTVDAPSAGLVNASDVNSAIPDSNVGFWPGAFPGAQTPSWISFASEANLGTTSSAPAWLNVNSSGVAASGTTSGPDGPNSLQTINFIPYAQPNETMPIGAQWALLMPTSGIDAGAYSGTFVYTLISS